MGLTASQELERKNNNGLSKELCATMCREVLGYVNANDNVYGV